MSLSFELEATVRPERGKGASRRLRHAKWMPAVIYGGGQDPLSITLDHDKLAQNLGYEAFFSHLLTIRVQGQDEPEQVILKDLQRHAYKPTFVHADFQRVRDDQEIQVLVPIHFHGEEVCPGVKESGGNVEHIANEVLVACLPAYLPEYLDVDLSRLHAGESVYLAQIPLPEGVEIVELRKGPQHDGPIANVFVGRR